MTRDTDLYDLLLDEPITQEERCLAMEKFIESRDGDIDTEVLDDLASWILFGLKDLSVKLQIELRDYDAKRDSSVTS